MICSCRDDDAFESIFALTFDPGWVIVGEENAFARTSNGELEAILSANGELVAISSAKGSAIVAAISNANGSVIVVA
jgi:hypothetical protein